MLVIEFENTYAPTGLGETETVENLLSLAPVIIVYRCHDSLPLADGIFLSEDHWEVYHSDSRPQSRRTPAHTLTGINPFCALLSDWFSFFRVILLSDGMTDGLEPGRCWISHIGAFGFFVKKDGCRDVSCYVPTAYLVFMHVYRLPTGRSSGRPARSTRSMKPYRQ